MKFKVRCSSKFESREDIHFKTQPGPVVWMCGNTLPALPYIYIYAELAPNLSATTSVAQLVERWSRNPDGAGSIPSRRP